MVEVEPAKTNLPFHFIPGPWSLGNKVSKRVSFIIVVIFVCCLSFCDVPLLLSSRTIDDAMTYPDLWNDFSFARASKRRRSAHGDSPQLNDLTSQYPILLSLAGNLSTLDIIDLRLVSRTTWHHLSAPKRPYLLRKGVVKTAMRCEGLHIQPRPQSPHQGTPYVLPCTSSQFVPVQRCESCGVAVCEVCQCNFFPPSTTQPWLTQPRHAGSTQLKARRSPTLTNAAGSSPHAPPPDPTL